MPALPAATAAPAAASTKRAKTNSVRGDGCTKKLLDCIYKLLDRLNDDNLHQVMVFAASLQSPSTKQPAAPEVKQSPLVTTESLAAAINNNPSDNNNDDDNDDDDDAVMASSPEKIRLTRYTRPLSDRLVPVEPSCFNASETMVALREAERRKRLAINEIVNSIIAKGLTLKQQVLALHEAVKDQQDRFIAKSAGIIDNDQLDIYQSIIRNIKHVLLVVQTKNTSRGRLSNDLR